MSIRLLLVLPILALGGCSETDVLQYQGRPAATALECTAAYEAARQRASTAAISVPSTKGAVIGTLIGSALISGAQESHYRTCLARVASLPGGAGTTATDGASTSAVAPRPFFQTAQGAQAPRYPATGAGCIAGGPVLQGGASYCTGN